MDYFVETEKGLVVELPDGPEKMPAKSLYLLNHSSCSALGTENFAHRFGSVKIAL